MYRKGQSTLEYAILIAIIVGALLAMQVYIKRGVQGRLRSAADDIGDHFSAGAGYYEYTTNSTSSTRETSKRIGNETYIESEADQTQDRTIYEKIGNYSAADENWGN